MARVPPPSGPRCGGVSVCDGDLPALQKNFWCYVGTGVARDAAVVGAADRLLSVLRDGIRAENHRLDITE